MERNKGMYSRLTKHWCLISGYSIDLTDRQVQQMLHDLQEDERKKAKDPSYVPPDRTGNYYLFT